MSACGSNPISLATGRKLGQGQVPPNPGTVVSDLLWLAKECQARCIQDCLKWANETLTHLPATHYDAYLDESSSELGGKARQDDCPSTSSTRTTDSLQRERLLEFVRSLVNDKEYRRAKFFLAKLERVTPVDHFIYYYCWYLISIQIRFEQDASELERKTASVENNFAELRQDIERLKKNSPDYFDCFMNYILGLIRKENKDSDGALSAFRDAIQQDHRCWPAWEELAKMVDVFQAMRVEKQEYGKSWQCSLFIAEVMFHLQLYLSAIEAYTLVASNALGASPYLLCHIATAQSELQEHDSAISSFQQVRKEDPYRFEQMNFFSDSLYIRQNFFELASLAKCFYESHKFHWETCCIVANYYSARNSHELAQDFLKRASRLNPLNASIWVLLGHEYMETKNHQLAISAYRKAIEIEPSGCYRGWYGLGQLYEIRKEPENALYFYQQAHKCRPSDSRMLIALGVIFCKIGRKSDAEKCFKKAFQVGDVEGNALTSLARLYDDQGDSENAAKAYEVYLTLYSEELIGDLDLVAAACQYLAKHNLNNNNLDTAYNYAQRCLSFETSKEEGFRILRLIMNKRQQESPQQEQGSSMNKERSTPAKRQVHQTNLIHATPIDALRPLGGGDESSIDTPAMISQFPVANDKEAINASDDDMEFSF